MAGLTCGAGCGSTDSRISRISRVLTRARSRRESEARILRVSKSAPGGAIDQLEALALTPEDLDALEIDFDGLEDIFYGFDLTFPEVTD